MEAKSRDERDIEGNVNLHGEPVVDDVTKHGAPHEALVAARCDSECSFIVQQPGAPVSQETYF